MLQFNGYNENFTSATSESFKYRLPLHPILRQMSSLLPPKPIPVLQTYSHQ